MMVDQPVAGCPKRMVMGPCGGVRNDGSCEVALSEPCVFDGSAVWPDPRPGVELATVPLVLTDFTSQPFSVPSLVEVAGIVRESCDAVLVGEHQGRPDFSPALHATLLKDQGLEPWMTLTCRDRNRVVLEQELVSLRHVGVGAVLCVTGDGRSRGVRPDVTSVFDLDGPRLTAVARDLGLCAAVPESPASPPVGRRAHRLVQKQRAGAAVAVLNYTRPSDVATCMQQAKAAGLTIPVIAGVAVYTDLRSAAGLDALPGLHVDHATVDQVVSAADPIEAGIQRAVAEARALLGIDGVVGVNLSGLASDRGFGFAAGVKADIARRIRAEQRT